ncbi:hypothetical protein L1987_13314 [Smallanthus sonchifolius]|uniref:Uncharacterized protein n=1 Tax=Smallanthus sonchifolius TaxID=185202 RepID=A0ACB9JI93_9ASTR|nr:hypothetical protein L1987_13314 [Smallanthus sonchifolius]
MLYDQTFLINLLLVVCCLLLFRYSVGDLRGNRRATPRLTHLIPGSINQDLATAFCLCFARNPSRVAGDAALRSGIDQNLIDLTHTRTAIALSLIGVHSRRRLRRL